MRASTREREDRRLPQEHMFKKARIAFIIVLYCRSGVWFDCWLGFYGRYYGATCVEDRGMNRR